MAFSSSFDFSLVMVAVVVVDAASVSLVFRQLSHSLPVRSYVFVVVVAAAAAAVIVSGVVVEQQAFA